jgi:hypothetical protein
VKVAAGFSKSQYTIMEGRVSRKGASGKEKSKPAPRQLKALLKLNSLRLLFPLCACA